VIVKARLEGVSEGQVLDEDPGEDAAEASEREPP
jgi:hypothetical protein